MSKPKIIHIPERVVEGKRLGRHVNHDPRSRNFPAEQDEFHSMRHHFYWWALNQKQVGSCPAEALCGVLNSDPAHKTVKKRYSQKDAYTLYGWETAAEGQPWPPNDPGGSGLEVCKVAQQHYWISSYTHAFGITQALQALMVRPVITGVSWYDSFDQPDSQGMVSIGSQASVRGGHEFLVSSVAAPNGATVDDLDEIVLWCMNSWGRGYGLKGRFGMTAATWNTLLQDRGDVTVPVP